LADRGSGNGTVVNGNIEDAPFSLANGDAIEIGNTQFRIDIPNGPQRIARASMDSVDEDEPSTVASKPLRAETPDPSPPAITPLGGHGRPKPMPPPMPPRARTASQMPPPLHLGSTVPPGATTPLHPSSYPVPSMSTPMRGSGVGPALQPLGSMPP